jgi:hypothetical protein
MQHAISGSSHNFHVMKTYNVPIIIVFIMSTIGEVIFCIFYETCEIGVYFGMLWIYKIFYFILNQNLKYSMYI